ncbi:MAG: dUTP diphosphatase [Elusimicrobiota bacterium]
MRRSLPFRKLRPDARIPTRAHEDDAGVDLYCAEDVRLAPGEGRVIGTGVAVAVPAGYVGLVADRSSMARKGLKTAGGVIDAGYRGEVGVVLWNISREPVELKAGDRVAQLLVLPVAVLPVSEADELDATQRGAGGFGSTGS